VQDWPLFLSQIQAGKTKFWKLVSNFCQILYLKVVGFYYALYFYFLPFMVIAFVSLFGNRAIDTDIKQIGVAGIEEIKMKDFMKNESFLKYYNSVNKLD
jgi:hypothetical protein